MTQIQRRDLLGGSWQVNGTCQGVQVQVWTWLPDAPGQVEATETAGVTR
jgi:hypothetical protein